MLIYLGVAVVHIQRVDLDVAQGPGAAARVTYRLLHSFDRLPDLTDRTASVTEDAEHLIINGIGAPGVRSAGRNSAFGFRASDRQGNGAVVQAREELIARHFTTRKGGWAPLYPDVDVPTNEYRDSLLHVAVLGRTLFNQLFNTPASRELAPMLQHEARARGRPPVVQIARTVRHPFVIPWQILYELPLEHPEAGTAMCPSVDEYGPDGNGAWPPPAACPHLGEHERALAEQPGRAFLCPFGFWGLAHILEVPEPPPGQRSLDHVITTSAVHPTIVTGVGTRLDADLVDRHLERVAAQPARLATTRDSPLRQAEQLRDALEPSDMDIVYLLGHCESTGPFGRTQALVFPDRTLTRDDIAVWARDKWPRTMGRAAGRSSSSTPATRRRSWHRPWPDSSPTSSRPADGSMFAWYSIGLVIGMAVYLVLHLILNGKAGTAVVLGGDDPQKS
ncbi:hypothetical protein [Streptomyces sp. NPDC046371]|uniref:hypothetical protein n=1 Tax=Streptomyces sp. NPDC046371 TaxID=3154916 RepID=UPI0033E3D601